MTRTEYICRIEHVEGVLCEQHRSTSFAVSCSSRSHHRVHDSVVNYDQHPDSAHTKRQTEWDTDVVPDTLEERQSRGAPPAHTLPFAVCDDLPAAPDTLPRPRLATQCTPTWALSSARDTARRQDAAAAARSSSASVPASAACVGAVDVPGCASVRYAWPRGSVARTYDVYHYAPRQFCTAFGVGDVGRAAQACRGTCIYVLLFQ